MIITGITRPRCRRGRSMCHGTGTGRTAHLKQSERVGGLEWRGRLRCGESCGAAGVMRRVRAGDLGGSAARGPSCLIALGGGGPVAAVVAGHPGPVAAARRAPLAAGVVLDEVQDATGG